MPLEMTKMTSLVYCVFYYCFRRVEKSQAWWQTPLIPVSVSGGRDRHLCEFKATLVYIVSSRTSRAT